MSARVDAGDRGAATVWGLALVTVLTVAALAGAVAGELALVRSRVSTVADLAALAGAQSSSACAAAARVVEANGLALGSCSVDAAGDVQVTVRSAPPPLATRVAGLLGGAAADVVAEARAGPP